MLERIKNLPDGIEGLSAIGKVTKEDYETVFMPLIEEARSSGRRLRFLYELGPGFDGFTASAAFEDAKLGLKSLRCFDGCAIVSDISWIRASTRLVSFMLPCPVEVFEMKDRERAITWLRELGTETPTTHRLDTETGIIVVEVRRPLRAQDFDALAQTADSYIKAHGELQGLVIHTRDFPGWDDLDAFTRHMRFVREHHKRVKRIALAADSKVVVAVSHLTEHFVKAELKTFDYDDLEAAVFWAKGPAAASRSAAAEA